MWSERGGTYALTLHVVGTGAENVRLSVNGAPVALEGLSARATLKKGDNEVRVFGDTTLPDIDFLEVVAQ